MERVSAGHANVGYAWMPPATALDRSMFAADRFHPNKQAHQLLAARLLTERAGRAVAIPSTV
jgi:phospholipase/lecithinase/hemolysin